MTIASSLQNAGEGLQRSPTAIVAAAELDLKVPFNRFTLSNGLTVIVHEDRKTPIVAINIWYRVGAKDEPAGKTGFAHLFEHLMCGGSKNLPGSILNSMNQVGATEINATTGYDRTNYFETVPTHALDFALFAESDRMGHFAISADTLELQRGVVLNEKLQNEGKPYGLVGERIFHASYPVGHPYAHTVIGSAEDIERATLDDVRNWFNTYYGPSNAVLVLAGDIDLETAREKVQHYFGDIPPGPPLTRPLTWIAKREGTRREVLEDRVPNALLQMAWNTPDAADAEGNALSVAAMILGSGPSSRLHRRLVDIEKIASNAGTGVIPGLIGGQFHLNAVVRDGADINAVERIANEELARFVAEGPTAEELGRALLRMQVDRIRGLTSMNAIADLLAGNEVYHGDPDFHRKELQEMARLTPDQVREAAAKWLSDGTYVLHVLPFGALRSAPEGADRSRPPALGEPIGIHLPALTEGFLSNGVRVLVAERHELPLVECKLLVPGGTVLEPRALAGVAGSTLMLLTSGAGERDAAAFIERMQDLGMSFDAGAGLDFSAASLSALRPKLDESLDVYADAVLRPRFEVNDLARVKADQLQGLAQQLAQPGGAVNRVSMPLMFGRDHAYAPAVTPASLAAITREAVVEFHEVLFQPEGATFLVVGDVTLEEVLPKLEARFGAWKAQRERPLVPVSSAAPMEPGIYLIDYPGATQSTVAAFLLAPAYDPSKEDALSAVNHVVGGSFSSRINMNLRENKHWTYGVGGGFRNTPKERVLAVQASVQADKTAQSIAEIRREYLDLIGTRPIDAGELQDMQSASILSAPSMLQTMGGLSAAIETLLTRKLPMDYWSGLVKRFQALDLETVNATAKGLIDPSKVVWVVAGDRESVQEALEGLGLGTVNIIDIVDGSIHPAPPLTQRGSSHG